MPFRLIRLWQAKSKVWYKKREKPLRFLMRMFRALSRRPLRQPDRLFRARPGWRHNWPYPRWKAIVMTACRRLPAWTRYISVALTPWLEEKCRVGQMRSEERGVGKECDSTGRSR